MNESKSKVLIGIDPDVEKSGFALYTPGRKQIETLQCYDLTDMMMELTLHQELYALTVHLEAGWLDKGTWHGGGHAMAKNVGANHEIGRQLDKFCKKQGIACKLIKPAGYSDWDHAKFCKVTGWPVMVKTNSEKRVAGMMVYGY